MEYHPRLLILYVFSFCCMSVDTQIFRSSCRKDSLMKAIWRNKRLLDSINGILSQLQVAGLQYCVKHCNGASTCLSVNYKQESGIAQSPNCQLLQITRTSEGASFAEAIGWVHYEPIQQPSPRCRNVACNPGYQCVEECGTQIGYKCADIDECASNPCQNGGTCSNLLNQYSCSCPSGFIGTNCQTAVVKPCSTTSVCLNGGSCQDLRADPMLTYKCLCQYGYGGQHCEISTNLALNRPTAHSSTFEGYTSSRAVDGNRNPSLGSGSCTHTQFNTNAWWYVDLGAVYTIETVRITNRHSSCSRLSSFDVKVGRSTSASSICYYYSGTMQCGQTATLRCTPLRNGKYVFVALRGTNFLSLCEVQIFAASTKYTSCRELKLATGTSTDGLYVLWDSSKSTKYSAYCHMSDGGWTLIARFSNADAKNWVSPSGSYWYDNNAVGSTTSTIANGDMINKAFYNAKGTDLKLTRSDSISHAYLFYASGCLSSTTFRTKITSYGDFRNNALWTKDKCLGLCDISNYGSVSGVSGFSQHNCNGELQSAGKVGFWCYWGAGDGAVMMIGGGGNSCARADHGIGITEENQPNFGSEGTMDFGDNSVGSRAYALNLWIK